MLELKKDKTWLCSNLLGETSEIKNSDKKKNVYSAHGITFDSAGFWSFCNETTQNVIIFGVDNSSSYQADNWKNSF